VFAERSACAGTPISSRMYQFPVYFYILTRRPVHLSHRTFPTAPFPQCISHRAFPHRTFPTVPFPPHFSHRTFPTAPFPPHFSHRKFPPHFSHCTFPTVRFPPHLSPRTFPTVLFPLAEGRRRALCKDGKVGLVSMTKSLSPEQTVFATCLQKIHDSWSRLPAQCTVALTSHQSALYERHHPTWRFVKLN